jgi:hypothetical protein
MPSMTDLAIALLLVTFVVIGVAFFNAIRTPASRKEMGIRLPHDSD